MAFMTGTATGRSGSSASHSAKAVFRSKSSLSAGKGCPNSYRFAVGDWSFVTTTQRC